MLLPSRRHALLAAGGVALVPFGAGFAEDAPMPRATGVHAPLDGLFLTYAGDPTTSVVVQWLGPAADPTAETVSYRPRGWSFGPRTAAGTVPVARKPYPLADLPGTRRDLLGLHVNRAVLTGLTPGTEYQFRVGTRPAVHRFRTMPARLTDAFHFVSGGDCGVGPHAVNVNRAAAAQDPMFCLVGGDLGYDNGRSVAVSVQFVRNYADTMRDTDGRLIPLVTTIGNHEVDGGYDKPRANAPFFFALFDGLFPEASYATLDFGDYLSLVLLDSGHVSKIEGDQTAWLAGQLAAREGRAHLIVANHVPAYPSHRDPGADLPGKTGTGAGNRRHWAPLFERHRVDVVLEHHDHTFKRTHPLRDGLAHPDGVVYLGDGSWGQLRPVNTPSDRPYLAAVSSSYHMTLHRLEHGQRFHLALGETGKVLDVTRTAKQARRNQVAAGPRA